MTIPETLKWNGPSDGCLEIIDQRKLPLKFEKLQCRDIQTLFDAIKTLAVRGAPAIGVAAAYGMVLGLKELSADAGKEKAQRSINKTAEYLTASRPTAVNLSWAVRRIKKKAQHYLGKSEKIDIADFKNTVLAEAHKICEQDKQMCLNIGENGRKLIRNGDTVLTHCNAGALATAGQGTALSIIYQAHKEKTKFNVYADETRPLLQGARLTAWELSRAGVEVTLICDNMAASLFRAGSISLVITGADRIAANGDTANKIGTYNLAVLAKHHKVPFYVAAPSSTFDLNIKSGSEIPIEQRKPDEIRSFAQCPTAPDNVTVYNPAFDVTDAELITAIVTEKGVIQKPDAEKIKNHLKNP